MEHKIDLSRIVFFSVM